MRSTWGNAWGEDAPADAAQPTTSATTWDQYLQAGKVALDVGLEAYKDPYRRLELAQARLANAKARGFSSPSRIRVLEAKVRAASVAVGVESAEETSDREYRLLGKLAIITGIVAGGAFTVLLLSGAQRVQRR